MTFERSSGGPAEPAPPASARIDVAGADGPTPVQIRLQILTTEHWSLLASRSLAWNESFTRAGMYLTTLSGALVALGLIGGIAGFGDAFYVFALVILPAELFIGFATFIRMGATNFHDAMTIYGMNRIRGAYLEIAPDLEPYFVMGTHDDPAGISITMAVPPNLHPILHLIAATPAVIVTLNGLVAGAIVALILVRFVGTGAVATVLVAVLIAILAVLGQLAIAGRSIRAGQRLTKPMFPTPGTEDRWEV